MDPLTAIGLAGNIITFIDFSYKVISGLNKGLDAATGMTTGNANLDLLAEDLIAITEDLISDAPPRTENEKQLQRLAASCHSLSEELVQILRALKVSDKKSKWQGVVVKWQSMRKEKDIEALERRLNGYQSEILIRLQVIFNQKSDTRASLIKEHIDHLRSEGQALHNETAVRLDTVQKDILGIVQAIKASPMSHDPKKIRPRRLKEDSDEPSLAALADHMLKFRSMISSFSYENHILGRLVFSSMYRREDTIEHAESGTFNWMVDAPGMNVQPDKETWIFEDHQEVIRTKTRENFLSWLSSGHKIFHISGKAGSGKSTLMKFLGDSARVREKLQSWAGNQHLIFARFFFWKSGDELQMSLEGLYRSLLFEVCRQSPALIPRIFPDLWQSLQSGFAPPQQTPMQLDEVKTAFNRLIQAGDTISSRICFFIDGLDEYQGDTVHHWHISQDLRSWTQSENIKLCVSSRPHTPFLQAFSGSSDMQIHIHDLTRNDIRQFCLAMFEKDPNFDRVESSYKGLVAEIVSNSSGVFLWARLVVRSLLKSVGYHSTAKDLHKKLVSMPKGLDGLFDQILGSIDAEDQKLSDTLFLLATTKICHWEPTVQNAISYSWLENLEDPDFPWNSPMSPCPILEIEERLQSVRCLLDRLSRGLLEIIPPPMRDPQNDGHGYFSWQVQFFHRTARDYIVDSRQVEIRNRVPNANTHIDIIRLWLAELKFARPTASDMGPPKTMSGLDYPAIRDCAYSFLTVLRGVQSDKYTIPPRVFEDLRQIFDGHAHPAKAHEDQQDCHTNCHLRSRIMQVDKDGEWSRFKESNYPPSYLGFIIQGGLYGLLPPHLKNLSRIQGCQSEQNPLFVACTVQGSGAIETVRELLLEGWSPKDTVLIETPSSDDNDVGFHQHEHSARFVSIWLVYLYELAFWYPRGYSSDLWEISMEFLHLGVDHNVQFVLSVGSSNANQVLGEPRQKFTLTLLELLEISKPPNLDAIRTLLQSSTPWWTKMFVSRYPSSSLETPLQQRHKIATLSDPMVRPSFIVESIVTSTERLDIPFSYRLA